MNENLAKWQLGNNLVPLYAQGVVAVKAAVTEAAKMEAGTLVAKAAEKAVVMAAEARAAVTMAEAPGVGCSGGDGAGGGPVTETQDD